MGERFGMKHVKNKKLQIFRKTLRETRFLKSGYQIAASITAEAAIAFCIFIFSILVFFNFFRIIETQFKLQVEASQVAEKIASYGYTLRYLEDYIGEYADLTEILPMSDEASDFVEYLIKKESGEVILRQLLKNRFTESDLKSLWIKGGFEGISFEDSMIYDKENVTIKMSYSFKLMPFERAGDIKTVQTVKVRCFSGYFVAKKTRENKEEEDNQVYVTEAGTVYHMSADCRSLKVTVETQRYEDIEALRNLNSGRYRACEKCGEKVRLKGDSTVYITPYGNCYHVNISCSGLKRVIQKLSLDEVGSRRACKLCGVILE